MSYELMRAMIEQSQATGLVKAVGNAVASYPAPGTNLAYPSNETLMADWGFSLRTLQRALRELETLGELQRQPQRETPERRRVYLVQPGFRRQLSIADAGCQIESGTQLARATPPATPRAPAYEGKEGKEGKPPLTPQRGELGTQVSEDFLDPGPTPHVVPSARMTAARSRRERRARRAERVLREERARLAHEAGCPLTAMTDSEASDAVQALEDAWREFTERLRERIDGTPAWDQWELWAAGAHPHAIGDRIEFGVEPAKAAWVTSRWGHLLADIAARPVIAVPCVGAPVATTSEE